MVAVKKLGAVQTNVMDTKFLECYQKNNNLIEIFSVLITCLPFWFSSLKNKLEKKKYLVKPVYNDHPWDLKIVVVVDKWSLFEGHLCDQSLKRDLKIVVVVDGWSLFGGGR